MKVKVYDELAPTLTPEQMQMLEERMTKSAKPLTIVMRIPGWDPLAELKQRMEPGIPEAKR